jgi:hypothetical protein
VVDVAERDHVVFIADRGLQRDLRQNVLVTRTALAHRIGRAWCRCGRLVPFLKAQKVCQWLGWLMRRSGGSASRQALTSSRCSMILQMQ